MSNTQLFYVHDPMCSWCYAFSSSWAALQEELPASVQVVYLLGGLAPDTTEPMPVDMQRTIQQAWRRIEKTVPHVQFNYDFWLLNMPFRSTYPACRAILSARKQGVGFEFKMLQAIQTAYYQKAKNPSLQSTLEECAIEAGLDSKAFLKDLASPVTDNELQDEIQQARKMNVFSYPSLCLQHNAKQFSISVDYLSHQAMIEEINRIMNLDYTVDR